MDSDVDSDADSGADGDADNGADGDEDSDADRRSVFARAQPDNGSYCQDTCSSSSGVTSPLSLVVCDGFPVVT